MKKMIVKNLIAVIIVVMMLSLMLNYIIQFQNCRESMIGDSKALFGQVERILQQNKQELAQAEAEYAEQCLNNARIVAYILEKDHALTNDTQALQELAAYLKVDEIHFFDETGLLYAGSVPEYVNLTMDSGEQIGFFKQMLTDKSLELTQDIAPNTAEEKPMQYSAVWDKCGENIVQIGMEPTRVLELTEKNELSYIFSLLLANEGVNLYAADRNTGEILGSTNRELVGDNLANIGLEQALKSEVGKGFEAKVNGERSYCYFLLKDDVLLGRSCSDAYMYKNINRTLFSLGGLISIVAVILVALVTRYLNQNIVQAIADVNTKLKEITEGNLDTKVDVNTSPEFTELSGRINEMVKSILATTDKMSAVLENADLSIGVYEYGAGMARVRATKQVAEILDIPRERAESMYANYIVFADYLDVIRSSPFDEERQIYAVPGEHGKYAKIESFEQGSSVFGMVTDVTANIQEQLKLEQERDVDILTGLHSRRAIYAMLDKKFEEPEALGYSAIILADADNLKKVNDQYGHEAGDKYLCGVADCLRAICPDRAEVARLGGDEFVVFIHNCARKELIEQGLGVLDALRGKRCIEVGGIEVPIQFSFGCAYCPAEGMDYHELLKLADSRMYEEKRIRKQKK
ncbi:MAG: diguanylate cyclase [Lachnospiraceae bacterium]|nr:diguanylate cyclase [Lachnospiraceae bacterium]